ncbi:hypothetical protein GQ55_6G225300 [Panicum hallii var. hallii]|uniref:Uncharacterized protein n=1 Tax=Panicum hallii var. hallii TaxID=1504633 RepID=A0A2T7D8J0_9POAL|nr:hypothetical protein GQ55_6G225300 [Panicum hallii var. hallii]
MLWVGEPLPPRSPAWERAGREARLDRRAACSQAQGARQVRARPAGEAWTGGGGDWRGSEPTSRAQPDA